MRTTVTKILSIAILLAVCFSAFACGGKTAYKNDVAITALADAGIANVSLASNLTEASEEFMSFFLNVDSSLYVESKVMTPVGSASIDEFGIFKATSKENAELIKEALDKYLASRVATWDTRYSQTEKPKVDGAKTVIFGSYVCYAILSEAEQAAFFKSVEEALK